MRSFNVRTLMGTCALLATFVLALPGVKAVRAAGSETPLASNDGGSCNPQGPEAEIAQSGVAMEQIRQQIAAQLGPDADSRIIVLNNRGYNYGPANPLDRATVGLDSLNTEH